MSQMYCLACPRGCLLTALRAADVLVVEGGNCSKAQEFAEQEVADQSRVLTTTVRTNFPDVPVISVKTDGYVPKHLHTSAMAEMHKIVITSELDCGTVVLENVADSGFNVVLTSSALMNIGAELEDKKDELNRNGANRSDGSSNITGSSVAVEPVEGVLDDIGEDAVGGVVGAAGEAVGVADGDGDDAGSKNEDERPKGRARVKIG